MTAPPAGSRLMLGDQVGNAYGVRMRARAIRVVVAALAAGSYGATVTSSAAAKPSPCPKKPAHVVAKTKDSYVYTLGKVLYGCASDLRGPNRVKKLGPWAPGSKATLSVKVVIWTVPTKTPGGAREDRIWVADPATGAWLKGVSPFPAPKASATTGTMPSPSPSPSPVMAADGDARVAKLIALYDVAAWVTQGGSVVGADYFSANDQTAVGAGTPGAAGTTDQPGLITPFVPVGQRLLIGRWGPAAVPQLASSIAFNQFDGEADGCAAVSEYQLVVKPIADQPEVGASWQHSEHFDLPECA